MESDDISRYKVIIIMGFCTIQDDGNNLGGRKDEVERMAELLRETDINNLMTELNTMERNDRKKLKELANQAFVFLAFYGNATGMTVVVNGQYSPRDNQNWLGFLKMAWDFQAGLVSGILKAGLDELKSTWELITTNPLETLKSIACLIKLIITDPGSIIKAFVNMIGDKGEEAINAFNKGDLYKFGLIIGACATAIAIIFVPVPVGKLTGATKMAKGVKNVAESTDDIAMLSKRIQNAGRLPPGVGGPGRVVKVVEKMSDRSRAYQRRITGLNDGEAYELNGIKFDGYDNGILLEAKGEGYATHIGKDGQFKPYYDSKDDFLDQIKRQTKAAAPSGTPIEWHVAEEKTFNLIRAQFEKEGYGHIKIFLTPP